MQRFWERIDRRETEVRQFHLPGAVTVAAASFGCLLLTRIFFDLDIPYAIAIVGTLAASLGWGAPAGFLVSITMLVGISLMNASFLPVVTARNTLMVAVFCAALAILGEALIRLRQRERQTARQSEQRERALQIMFQDSPAVTMVLSQDNRIATANVAAERLFRVPRSTLIGERIDTLLAVDDLDAGQSTATAIVGDRQLMLTASLADLMLGGDQFRILYLRDDTDAIAAAEALALTQRELHRISRAVALGQLGSSIAHELNQPLSFAANYAAAAQSMLAAPDIDREAVTDAIGHALDHLFSVAAMLKKLRGFVNRRESDREWVGIDDLVKAAEGFAALATKGLDVRVTARTDTSAEAFVDTVLIQQVILNLVTNAVDAVREQDRREVMLIVQRIGEDELCIAVEDSGLGIPSQRRGDIFAPFRSSKPDGVGIGLAICRTIVEAHGGQISATDATILGGARLQFTVPARMKEVAG